MADTIVNRVAASALITFDLEKLYQIGTRQSIDLSQWLHQGLLLKEKEFRALLKAHDWSVYRDQFIALHCSTDAILPAWAALLVTTHLQPYARKVVLGTLNDLEVQLFAEEIQLLDISQYKDQPLIIKGCSDKTVPQDAYVQLIAKLQPVVKSLFYGEACSSVPLYKKKK
ncbi:MAG: DUF2480 family protein [Bacteroidetes bacterium]|jgi:hypothetical protein|nr:DUF2480 family protein [Flavobacteriaceae bacterium]MDG1029050.1 DUF2480 family protein [Flavobacteriaceae bacterium]MDG1940743.1 DUF2480 family protein [Flavobacteriaceae bacterium]NCF30970.1 DUF2480 family protein [Bacteroidota bacterium]